VIELDSAGCRGEPARQWRSPRRQGPSRDVGGLATTPRGKPRRENQTKLRGRQQVVGDGM